LNAELCKKALEKVGNPNVLINVISRRVRQLNAGDGGHSRPLIAETATLGVADIALKEIIEGNLSFDIIDDIQLAELSGKKRKRQ
jgi:DNA-directed RNA polymerase subunit omega